MGFTDNCSIFASVHENAFNKVLGHMQRQRPSLFNYASKNILRNPDLLCHKIEVAPTNNPGTIVTTVPMLPVVGSAFSLDWCLQITKLELDFHPNNAIGLPVEISPLAPQGIALHAQLCLGLGCPKEDLSGLVPPPDIKKDREHENGQDPSEVPIRTLDCFCVDVFGTLRAAIASYSGKQYLELRLDGFEVVDVGPDSLESMIECYAKSVIQLSLFPKIRLLLEKVSFDIMKGVSVSLFPTPISPAVPNNPAVENDLLKVLINVAV